MRRERCLANEASLVIGLQFASRCNRQETRQRDWMNRSPKKLEIANCFQGRIQSMEARLVRAAIVVAAILSCGAGHRSQNFIVSAPTPELSEEICRAAETYRRDLAIEWLGKELPPWDQPCPIKAQVHPQLGAGGATSFMFNNRRPFGWTMDIQGSRERVLDSVLPHEVTHTIFATHFGGPLPRWADEGACTTVEHPGEKAKQERFLIEFLTSDPPRAIPFNKMFAMTEYPRDILPLYSQGYSLARFLIQQGGKRKYIQYVGDGMRMRNWTAATKQHYGFGSLSELQVSWLDWVRQGSPDMAQPATEALVDMRGAPTPAAMAAASTGGIPAEAPPGYQTIAAQNQRLFASGNDTQSPLPPTNLAAGPATAGGSQLEHSSVSRPVTSGWYARKRDQAQSLMQGAATPSANHSAPEQPTTSSVPRTFSPGATRAIPPPPTRRAALDDQALTPVGYEAPVETKVTFARPRNERQVIMEWSRSDNSKSPRGDVRDLAAREVASGNTRSY